MTAELSAVVTFAAACKTAFAAASGDRVSRSTLRAVMMAVWSRRPSQIPSVARSKNSVVSLTLTKKTSGVQIIPGTLFPVSPTTSPKARETCTFPSTYPPSTLTPISFNRCFSSLFFSGAWSAVVVVTLPSSHRTPRQSPTFRMTSSSARRRAMHATVPEDVPDASTLASSASCFCINSSTAMNALVAASSLPDAFSSFRCSSS
mmetsp:Transcript_59499/g.139383  ORF Transcript_59499/g.139383 Transcript_59499/m.139383 type:complete len:204 (-) Transcript_59499:297-908(-)